MKIKMTEKMNTVSFSWKNIDNKKLKEQKIKEETKKELSEFDILKEATKQFDIFKNKINDLNLPDKIKNKIMDDATSLFYNKDNDLNKLKWIKYLNGLIDTINKKKDDIFSMKEKIQNYINNSMEDGMSIEWYVPIWIIIAFAILFVWTATETLSYVAAMSLLVIIGVWTLSEVGFFYNDSKVMLKNKLFDMINSIYPQITEDEYNKIYDLYDDHEIDMVKFTKMMEKYEKDGKITPEERKKIDKFISKPSK